MKYIIKLNQISKNTETPVILDKVFYENWAEILEFNDEDVTYTEDGMSYDTIEKTIIKPIRCMFFNTIEFENNDELFDMYVDDSYIRKAEEGTSRFNPIATALYSKYTFKDECFVFGNSVVMKADGFGDSSLFDTLEEAVAVKESILEQYVAFLGLNRTGEVDYLVDEDKANLDNVNENAENYIKQEKDDLIKKVSKKITAEWEAYKANCMETGVEFCFNFADDVSRYYIVFNKMFNLVSGYEYRNFEVEDWEALLNTENLLDKLVGCYFKNYDKTYEYVDMYDLTTRLSEDAIDTVIDTYKETNKNISKPKEKNKEKER